MFWGEVYLGVMKKDLFEIFITFILLTSVLLAAAKFAASAIAY